MAGLARALREDRRLRWTAVFATVAVAVAVAVPTVLIPNPVFGRMIAAEWWHYAAWLATAPLMGINVALYRQRACPIGATAAGGFATVFAVGCPTCNALVVAALGTSGALSYFAPLQPVLGLAAVALLVYAARRQLRARDAARDPATAPARD